MEPKVHRQKVLWQNKQFICNCTRCEGESASLVQRKRISADPNYRKIVSKGENDVSRTMKEKCETFLRLYAQIPWCDEIGKVINAYITIIRSQLIGPVNLDILCDWLLKNLNLPK